MANKHINKHFPPPPPYSYNSLISAGSAVPAQPRLSGACSATLTALPCYIWVDSNLGIWFKSTLWLLVMCQMYWDGKLKTVCTMMLTLSMMDWSGAGTGKKLTSMTVLWSSCTSSSISCILFITWWNVSSSSLTSSCCNTTSTCIHHDSPTLFMWSESKNEQQVKPEQYYPWPSLFSQCYSLEKKREKIREEKICEPNRHITTYKRNKTKLFCSIPGCALPLQEAALCQSPPIFSVLCHPCPYHSLLPYNVISPMTFWSSNWSYALYL